MVSFLAIFDHPANEVAQIFNLADRRIVLCSLSAPLAAFTPHSPQFSASTLLRSLASFVVLCRA
jgi:hypothetical protein